MTFRERNELLEYMASQGRPLPTSPQPPSTVFERILLECARWRFRHLSVGSPAWHIWQERVSRGPACGWPPKLRAVFYETTLPACGPGLYMHPHCTIYYPANLTIGSNAYLNRGVFITARTTVAIGNDVLVGPYTVINSGNHTYNDPTMLIRDQGHEKKPIVIQDDVWICAHVTIVAGVTVGRGSVLAAGAVVTHDVPPNKMVAGVPAKVLRTRGIMQ